jgi:hypothetical protein
MSWASITLPAADTRRGFAEWMLSVDLYDEESGTVIFPLIGLGSSLGAWAGARIAGDLFLPPLIALGSYSLMALLPAMGVVRIAKVLENSTDYSVQNRACRTDCVAGPVAGIYREHRKMVKS